MKTNLVIQHNGSILFVPPGILKSICPFNIASFPFVSFNYEKRWKFFIFTIHVFWIYKIALWNLVPGPLMNLVCKKIDFQKNIDFINLGVNLTAEGNTGQLDAYVKNAEWDLQGI